jgi:hypothetical protein
MIVFTVFWLEEQTPHFFQLTDLVLALSFMESKRQALGVECVTMHSKNDDRIGQDGVDAVENGVCPDGTDYNWKKRR